MLLQRHSFAGGLCDSLFTEQKPVSNYDSIDIVRSYVPHAEKDTSRPWRLLSPDPTRSTETSWSWRRQRPEAAKNGKLQPALSYASFPLDFLSPTLNTSISLHCMQEVNTAGAGVRILLNISRGEGKDQRCLKKRGGEGGRDVQGAPSWKGPVKRGEGMLSKMDSTVCLPSVKSS